MLRKSPSGPLCPYYYKGGELHPLHYGSYQDDMAALSDIIDAEEAFILSSMSGRYVWIDLYETHLTEAMTRRLAGHIAAITPKVSKMALVGCPKKDFRRLVGYLKKSGCRLAEQISSFADPELAKDWLVGKA